MNQTQIEEIKKLIDKFKTEQLPNSEKPFHYEAEVWSGMQHFIQWLDTQ